MNPVCPRGHNVTYQAKGCGDLPAAREPVNSYTAQVLTSWTPTEAERQLIAAGEPVSVAILVPAGESIFPMSVFVEGGWCAVSFVPRSSAR